MHLFYFMTLSVITLFHFVFISLYTYVDINKKMNGVNATHSVPSTSSTFLVHKYLLKQFPTIQQLSSSSFTTLDKLRNDFSKG